MLRSFVCAISLLFLVQVQISCRNDGSFSREAIGNRMPDVPFSDVVRAGNTYYFSGKVGIDPGTGKLAEGGIEAETKAVMEAFKLQFQSLGMGFEDLVMSTVYLSDINDFQAMNQVYKSYFTSAPPARATVAVKDLVLGARIEIAFIAAKSD